MISTVLGSCLTPLDALLFANVAGLSIPRQIADWTAQQPSARLQLRLEFLQRHSAAGAEMEQALAERLRSESVDGRKQQGTRLAREHDQRCVRTVRQVAPSEESAVPALARQALFGLGALERPGSQARGGRLSLCGKHLSGV